MAGGGVVGGEEEAGYDFTTKPSSMNEESESVT
jgi:hypothetical protein